MVFIRIMLYFEVLYSSMVLWVFWVMLFRVLSVGEGWINVEGWWDNIFMWVLFFIMLLLVIGELGLIVSIVIFKLFLIRCNLKVFINVDLLILGMLVILMWILLFV